MPNNIMFSNKEALRKAVERVEWKMQMSYAFLSNDPVFKKYVGGQYGFDIRDVDNLFLFFVNIKDYEDKPEEERIKLFNSEASKIAHAFYETHGETDGMPDYKSVEPYIRRMYDEVDADYNIDWDDVDAIEHYLSSLHIQQTLGMMAEKFAVEFAKNFTLEEKQSIDSKMQSTFANQRIFQSKLVQENSNYSKRLGKGSMDQGTCQYFIEAGISIAVAKATKNGYDPIVLDPEYSEVFKNYFVNDEFEVDQTGEVDSATVFNQDDAADAFAEFLPKISAKNAFEHVAVQSTTNDYIYPDEEFVLVDGKSVNDYIKEQVVQGMTTVKAKIEAGKWLRSAMLDGNSVVTLMRPIINEDGSVVFQHQQIKTDLDKVNAIDRAENYSWFRRALDALRIYRIPKKCVSNKARDAVQAQKLAGAELQNALKAVEDKFIERYNLRASQEFPYKIQSAFPKLSRIENVMENQVSSDAPVNSIETEPVRVSLNLSSQDLEKPASNVSEEPKEINSEEVKIEENTIEELQVQTEKVLEEPVVDESQPENKEEAERKALEEEQAQLEEERIKLEEMLRKSEQELATLNEEIEKIDNQLELEQERVRAEEERRNLRDTKKALDEQVKKALEERKELERQKELQEREASQKKAGFFSRKNNIKDEGTVGPVPTAEVAHELYESPSMKEETIQLITDAMQKIYDNAIYKTHFDLMFDVTKVTLYSSLSHNLSSCWSEFDEAYREESKENVLGKYAIKEFKSAYMALDFFTYGISESRITNTDRWLIAQKIADIKLNRYYPVASNSKYAKFGQNYFTQHPDHEFLAKWFASKEDIKQAVIGVTEELNNSGTKLEAPKIDYSIIDLVTEQEAVKEARYNISYEKKAREAHGNITLSAEIKQKMIDIVNNPDITPERAEKFVEHFRLINEHSLVVRVNNHMDEEVSEASRPEVMAGGAQHVFHEIYIELRNSFIFENTVDRVLAAQKIADMLLNAYTPVAFEPDKYLKYGDNYVLNNVDILREEMEDTYADCAKNDEAFAEFMDELKAARLGKSPTKDEEETEQTEEEADKENEEITDSENADSDREFEEQKLIDEESMRKAEEETQSKAEEAEAQRKAEEEAIKATSAVSQAAPQTSPLRFGCEERAHDAMQNRRVISNIESTIREALDGKVNKSLLNINMINNLIGSMFEVSDKFNRNHDALGAAKASAGKVEGHIQDGIQTIFQNAYIGLNPFGMQKKDQIIAAQKISDAILNSVTPVAFNDDMLEKYTQNYAINDPTMVSDVLQYAEGFSKNICNELAEEARAALLTVVEEPKTEETVVEEPAVEEPKTKETVVEEPEQEIKTEETVVEEPKTEETVVEEPKTEEPVVEEPVVEAPVVEEKPDVQSEEEVAKIQAEAEETQKKLEQIKNNVQQITVTEDNFKELFEVAKNDKALEAKVRVELEAVLNEVYTGAYVHDNATSILYTASTIPNLFPDGQFTTEDSNIGGMVFEIFDDAYNKLDSAKVDIDQKIIYAQKIADIVVRNYPPVCHDIDGFSKFADNYIINGTTLYSQDKLRAFLQEKEIPEEEIEAHVSRINGAVAKPDDVKEERYEPEELDNPFKHGPNYIHQNKAEAPKINRFKPRRLFGQGEGELYSAGRHQARKDELERLRSYDQEAMAKTEAIAEDALEYLEDIEEENIPEETTIETNENAVVAEPENKEEEPNVEQVTDSINEIANSLVENALSDAMAELEEEARINVEQKTEPQPIPMPVVPEGHLIDSEEAEKNDDEIINNFVEDVFASAKAEVAEEQRKAEEEANRKAEEEEARRRAEEEAKEEADRRKAESDEKKTNIVLRRMCERRIRDTKIAVETREQLFQIFRNPRYEDKQLITCVNMANEIPEHMADQFEKARYDLLTPRGVERMTKSVFREALYCTEESGYDLVTRIGMAQRITDLMMKDYSVAAFVPTEFGTYADNYIVLNKGILKELIKDQTSNLSENEVSDLMKRVDREMARELSGWYSRDVERRLNSLVLPYEEIYEKIMGDKAPELKEVSLEEFRNFKAQYDENLKNSELTENVKAQISEIYAEAGLKDSVLEAATNAAFNDFVDIMTQTYDDLQTHTEYLQNAKKMMTYTAEATLHYVVASANRYINDISERLVISQRITDVLLNNYSPAAFVNGDLDKFADNYITTSNDRLDSWMQDYYYGGNSKDRASIIKNVEKLMNRAKDDVVEEEINDEPEEIDEDDIDDIEEEIEETPKVEEKPKAEEKYERKVVDKYERKVEGIDLPANGIVGGAEIEFFRDECNKSVEDSKLTEYVKSQIGGILADGGVSESKILKTVDNIFDKCLGKNGMLAFYDRSNSLAVHNIKAEAMMSNIVKHSAKFLSNATDGCFASLEEGFVVNQKILDVILKNYSPVAFAKDDLSQYANNYLLDRETAIAGYYQTFVNRSANVNDMEAFVTKVQEIRAKENREKITVDLSAVAQTKVDSTKTETPQTAAVKVEESNPLKERIALDEFSAKTSDVDVSAKVEKNNAPVVSNVKE